MRYATSCCLPSTSSHANNCLMRTVTQSITDSSRVVEGMYGQSLRSPPSARRRRKPHPRSACFCSSLYRRFSCSWKPRTTRRWRVSPKKMLYSRCVEFLRCSIWEQRGGGGSESFMQASAMVSPGAGQPAGPGLRFAGLGWCCSGGGAGAESTPFAIFACAVGIEENSCRRNTHAPGRRPIALQDPTLL